ncbi:MAG: vWA domain-containing protein, partial [Lawsonibacter sp.]|nr:vWA domain-containing protein [Lawsonibacter sp.]
MKASKQQLKRLGRRGLSLLMAMTMCLSLIQISAFATADPNVVTQTNNQITHSLAGGTVSYTGAGTVTTGSDWAVQLSRTLEATGTENLFNVNMEVVTKDGAIEVTNSSAAVTLVLDTSTSMRNCAECGYDPWSNSVSAHNKPGTYTPCSCRTNRLQAAKAALASFLTSYAKDDHGNFYSSPRMVSLVTFSDSASNWDLSSASGNQYWVNVNSQDALDYIINNVINGTETYGSQNHPQTRDKISASGYTNTDDGMSTAADLLNTTTYSSAIGSIDNRFCVLLTDGQPTTCNYPDGWWDLSYPKTYYAQLSCADVTGTGAALYSIAYGMSGDTVQAEGVGDVPIITKDGNGVVTGGWLKDQCGSTAVYDASSASSLNTALHNILTDTNQSTTTTNGVTASIGQLLGVSAHAYTFIGFNDDNGLVLNGATPATSYNGASVTADSLEWNLSAASSVRDDGAQTTTYSLSYQVRLNNNEADFQDWTASNHAAAAEYSVGSASLTYQYTALDDSVTTPQVAFPDVKAHGYLGHFDFMKIAHHQDANSNVIPLAGAPFTLTNSANAALYVPANAMTQNTTSQTNAVNETLGKVAFTAIPSGYAYTLSETGEFTYNSRT